MRQRIKETSLPKVLGVMGHPVKHSQSPRLFAQRFEELGRTDLTYEKFDLPNAADFPSWSQSHPEVVGLNVTVPHKKSLIPHLHGLSHEAQAVGAVNTLVRTTEGWMGHNTDVWGFQRSIQPFLAKHHERALVLGTGGSAAAVHHVLGNLGIDTVGVSRSGNSAHLKTYAGRPLVGYQELNGPLLQHHLLVVHCTPVGMSPHTDQMVPLPVEHLGPQHLVVDLIYTPRNTLLLSRAKAQGAEVLHGGDMLRLQADRAWDIWAASGV